MLLACGLSIALLDTIEPSSLYALLTPESSKFIEWNKIPEARFAIYSSALLTPEISKFIEWNRISFIEWNKISEARFAIYSSPLSTKLLVDCASSRATITEPRLIEAGVRPLPIQPMPKLEPEPGKGRPRAPS